jgi:hypothetical protein
MAERKTIFNSARELYTLIRNDMIQDERLSNDAFRLFCYMWSLPDATIVNSDEIAERLLGGMEAKDAAIQNLIACGYCEMEIEEGREDEPIYILNERTVGSNPTS